MVYMKWNIVTNFITLGREEPSGGIRMAASQRQAQTAMVLWSLSLICGVWVVIFIIG